VQLIQDHTQTDLAGGFRLERIAPGDYGVFAWGDVETGVWQDPEFMRLYEGRGISIRMGEGGRGRLDVVAMPPGP
jgi:hypothetical protein